MEIKYYLQRLPTDDACRDEKAILRFPAVVKTIAPEVECHVTRLDNGNIKAVEESIGREQDIHNINSAILEILVGEKLGPIPKLVICCTASSPLATMAEAAAPHAKWGVACSSFTAIYQHEPALVWHEMLHLLGAEDCYENAAAKDKTCGHDNCIMQYAPTVEVVGDPPFLCEKNVQTICGRWEKYCKKETADGEA